MREVREHRKQARGGAIDSSVSTPSPAAPSITAETARTPKLLTSVVTSVLLTPRTLVNALVIWAMYESSTRSRMRSGGLRS